MAASSSMPWTCVRSALMFACFLDGKLHLEAWSISPGFGGILQAAMSRSVQSSRGFHAHPCELRQSRIDFLV